MRNVNNQKLQLMTSLLYCLLHKSKKQKKFKKHFKIGYLKIDQILCKYNIIGQTSLATICNLIKAYILISIHLFQIEFSK